MRGPSSERSGEAERPPDQAGWSRS